MAFLVARSIGVIKASRAFVAFRAFIAFRITRAF